MSKEEEKKVVDINEEDVKEVKKEKKGFKFHLPKVSKNTIASGAKHVGEVVVDSALITVTSLATLAVVCKVIGVDKDSLDRKEVTDSEPEQIPVTTETPIEMEATEVPEAETEEVPTEE